jgi:hypothetical protein
VQDYTGYLNKSKPYQHYPTLIQNLVILNSQLEVLQSENLEDHLKQQYFTEKETYSKSDKISFKQKIIDINANHYTSSYMHGEETFEKCKATAKSLVASVFSFQDIYNLDRFDLEYLLQATAKHYKMPNNSERVFWLSDTTDVAMWPAITKDKCFVLNAVDLNNLSVLEHNCTGRAISIFKLNEYSKIIYSRNRPIYLRNLVRARFTSTALLMQSFIMSLEDSQQIDSLSPLFFLLERQLYFEPTRNFKNHELYKEKWSRLGIHISQNLRLLTEAKIRYKMQKMGENIGNIQENLKMEINFPSLFSLLSGGKFVVKQGVDLITLSICFSINTALLLVLLASALNICCCKRKNKNRLNNKLREMCCCADENKHENAEELARLN